MSKTRAKCQWDFPAELERKQAEALREIMIKAEECDQMDDFNHALLDLLDKYAHLWREGK